MSLEPTTRKLYVPKPCPEGLEGQRRTMWEHQEQFLVEYSRTRTKTTGLRLVGISPQTEWDWFHKDMQG